MNHACPECGAEIYGFRCHECGFCFLDDPMKYPEEWEKFKQDRAEEDAFRTELPPHLER